MNPIAIPFTTICWAKGHRLLTGPRRGGLLVQLEPDERGRAAVPYRIAYVLQSQRDDVEMFLVTLQPFDVPLRKNLYGVVCPFGTDGDELAESAGDLARAIAQMELRDARQGNNRWRARWVRDDPAILETYARDVREALADGANRAALAADADFIASMNAREGNV